MSSRPVTPTAGAPTTAGPARPAGTIAKPKRRSLTAGASSNSMGGGNAGLGSAGMLRMWYKEDSPGLQLGPVAVLVMSLVFIAAVGVLHVLGRLRG